MRKSRNSYTSGRRETIGADQKIINPFARPNGKKIRKRSSVLDFSPFRRKMKVY